MKRILELTSLLLLLTTLTFLVLYVSRFSSTALEFSPPKDLVELEFGSRAIGFHLWGDRSQDVIIQALVLFAAALGSLLFFRAEGW